MSPFLDAAVSGSDTPPSDAYVAALWLVDRHPVLAELVARVPGAVIDNSDGTRDVDLELLAQALTEYDDDRRAECVSLDPDRSPPVAAAVAVMSGSERTRLSLLASLGRTRVPWRLWDLAGLDAEGRGLVRDWARIMQAVAPW